MAFYIIYSTFLTNFMIFKGAQAMKYNSRHLLLAASSTLLLAACSSNNVESINETTTEASDIHSELVTNFNELFEYESNLQTRFNETIEEDSELTSLEDESSLVYENIDQRSGLLDEIESLSSDLQSEADTFANYSGEDLAQDKLQSLSDNLNELDSSISDYSSNYSTALDNQSSYFDNLTNNDAEYQDFINGIESINEEHSALKESASAIDQQLSQTAQQLNNLHTETQNLLNEEASAESQSSGAVATNAEGNETQKNEDFQYQINPETWTVDPLENSDANPKVALLTFDDAPEVNALRIAESLEEKDANAIFFVNGMYIEDEEGQEELKQIHDMGFEIGNHTHTHANLQTVDEQTQTEEITATSDLVEEVTGERPRFFRAPHGANTEHSMQVAEENGMTVMNWTYGYDWEPEYQEPKALADIMVNTELLNNGGSLLMHDRTWTADAVPAIVDGLREKDYEIVDPDTIVSVQNTPESEEAN